MKHIKWYTWLGIGLLFVILTLTFGKAISTISHVAHSNAITVKVESEEVDHLIQLHTETKDAGSLTSVKSIPSTNIESIDVPLQNWANEKEEDFFAEMEETELLLGEDVDAHFSLHSEIKPLNEQVYAFMITSEQSVDQLSDYQHKQPFMINIKEEQILSLTDITNDTLTINNMYKILEKHSDVELEKEKFNTHYTDVKDFDWAIYDETIIFYFQPNTITGNQHSIKVPLNTFYPYLNDHYYEVFISEDMDTQIKEKIAADKAAKEKKMKETKNNLQEKKYIALTFDDGPNPKETPKILKTLKKYNAKATFFTLANNVKNYPNLAKQIVDEGHEIANHSMSHANLNAVKKKKAKQEIVDSQNVIEEITGVKPTLFRPPYGNFKDDTQKMINDSGQDIILWTVDTTDWKSKNANTVFNNAKSHSRPGAIILMHDIYPTTADAIPKLLKYYEEQGYECVTVSELLPYIEDTYNGAYFGY